MRGPVDGRSTRIKQVVRDWQAGPDEHAHVCPMGGRQVSIRHVAACSERLDCTGQRAVTWQRIQYMIKIPIKLSHDWAGLLQFFQVSGNKFASSPTFIATPSAPVRNSGSPQLSQQDCSTNIMAGGTSWKIAVLVAVMTLFTLLAFHPVEAQVAACSQCAAHANCFYNSYNGYYCRCRRGWYGDGYVGTGYSGCRRRRLRTWQVVISIIGAILGALLILCLCLACLRNLLLRRRARGPFVQQPGDPVYGYPQQAHPQQAQQGVPMYETNLNNQKVPGPAGVV